MRAPCRAAVLLILVLVTQGMTSSVSAQPPLEPATVSPTQGLPGTRVVVDVECGDPGFEFRLSVQFRAAGEPVSEPFQDPRLDYELLDAPGGHVRAAVGVPLDAVVGPSFFDVLCLNLEGGAIPGTEGAIRFTVTALPATGLPNAPILAGAAALVVLGLTLVMLSTRASVRP